MLDISYIGSIFILLRKKRGEGGLHDRYLEYRLKSLYCLERWGPALRPHEEGHVDQELQGTRRRNQETAHNTSK